MKPRHTRWLTISLLLAGTSLLLAACDWDSVTITQQEKVSESGTETITLESGQPLVLEIQNNVGSVTLVAGQAGQVVIDFTKTAYADSVEKAQDELAAMPLVMERRGDSVWVDGRQPENRDNGQSNTVDLRIQVPAELALSVVNNVGSVALTGLRAESAELEVNVGDIRFDGALDAAAGSRHTFRVNVGSITLELAEDSHARLDAAVNVGEIRVSGFTIQDLDNERGTVSEDWQGVIGSGESDPAGVNLRVEVGDITVRQG